MVKLDWKIKSDHDKETGLDNDITIGTHGLLEHNHPLFQNIAIIIYISIITQVIIEILAFSLADNGVIICYNHLRRGDYSGRTNFQNNRLARCQCV